MSYEFYITPEEYTKAAGNGVSPHALEQRIRVYGWQKSKAIATPIRREKDRLFWRRIADKNGIAPGTFYRRVNGYGWDIEKAATVPTIDRDEARRIGRETMRKYPQEFIDLASRNGISAALFRERVRERGLSYEEAATQPRMSLSESGRLGKLALERKLSGN